MDTPTPQEIAAVYASALDSVNIVDAILGKISKTEEEIGRLTINANHLTRLLAQTYWTTENLIPFNTAVDAATTWLALGMTGVIETPQPAHNPITQSVVEGAPVQTPAGHWEQTWSVIALDASAIAANLAAEKATLIKKIDTDTDAIIRAVIGNRTSEYELAEKEANDYKTAGYPASPVPGSVSAWATAKGWTNTLAADDIIATANAWRQAQASIRANRLAHKENARNAADVTALDTVKSSWSAFCTTIKGQLGV